MIDIRAVSGGYPNQNVLHNISFTVDKGELFGILGPNGSGKTTLLNMLSGLLLPTQGEVHVNQKPLQTYSQKQLAKIIAVLPQATTDYFAYTVKETVMLGRYAHQEGWFKFTSNEDEVIVQEAMAVTGIDRFQDKWLQQLSGGERQRVFLAQALAQQPQILLLDEPTNHLDLSYQKDLLDELKKWTIDRGISVISIFHDVNIASLYCDRLLLLNQGSIQVIGKPHEVLQEKYMTSVYGTTLVQQSHPASPEPQMLLLPGLLTINQKPIVAEQFLASDDTTIKYISPVPLKTMATGLTHGNGIGWYHIIVSSVIQEQYDYETIYFKLAEPIRLFRKTLIEESGIRVLVVQADQLVYFIFEGKLTEEAFVELVAMVAAERAMMGKPVATIVIAATQTGLQANLHKIKQLILTEMENFEADST